MFSIGSLPQNETSGNIATPTAICSMIRSCKTLTPRFVLPVTLVMTAWAFTCLSPARADYRQKAEEATDFVQTHFYNAQAKRYHGTYPLKKDGLEWEFMWGNGVQLGALADAARENPEKYKIALYDFTEGLQTYWDPAVDVPGYNAYCSGPNGTDKYYDDNEWVVLDYVNAYDATKDPKFLTLARETQKFVLSGWDEALGGGIYWKLDRKGKNTCSNAPAAAAALRLAQSGGDKDQIEWALKIKKWTDSNLQDKDGLYWDGMNLDGKVEKTKWSYNTAMMIWTDLLLYQLKQDPGGLKEAKRLADAGLAQWTDPMTGSLHKTEDSPLFTHLFCEALLRLYDVCHDVKYLNAVRAEASFATRYCRAPGGGYWEHWKKDARDDRQTLIISAAASRLFWLLTPYPDVDALYDQGIKASERKKDKQAEALFRQAADSDFEDYRSRYRLMRVLTRERKAKEAGELNVKLTEMAKDPVVAAELTKLGWSAAAPSAKTPEPAAK